MNKWEQADLISDRIVEILNEERQKPESTPLQLLAGVLLGLRALCNTAPSPAPHEFTFMVLAVDKCLRSILRGEYEP